VSLNAEQDAKVATGLVAPPPPPGLDDVPTLAAPPGLDQPHPSATPKQSQLKALLSTRPTKGSMSAPVHIRPGMQKDLQEGGASGSNVTAVKARLPVATDVPAINVPFQRPGLVSSGLLLATPAPARQPKKDLMSEELACQSSDKAVPMCEQRNSVLAHDRHAVVPAAKPSAPIFGTTPKQGDGVSITAAIYGTKPAQNNCISTAPALASTAAAPIFGTTPAQVSGDLPRLLGLSGRICSPMKDSTKKPAADIQDSNSSSKIRLERGRLGEQRQLRQQHIQQTQSNVVNGCALEKPAYDQQNQERDFQPAKVFMTDCVCAVPTLDPSVPVKKRVPEWVL